jgi:tetratricopeptide (TPR) repeat protein
MSQPEHTLEDSTITARELLMSGNFSGAIQLLDGLREVALEAQYPSFFIVLAEALIADERLSEARQALREALHISPNSPRPALLLEGLNDHTMGASPAKNEPIRSRKLGDLLDIEFTSATSKSTPSSYQGTPVAESDHRSELGRGGVQFDLEKVASDLSSERTTIRPTPIITSVPSPSKPTTSDEPAAPALVSETLAKLLVQQGKLEEARKVYIQLSRLEPNRYSHYQERINELRSAQ